MLDWLSVVVAVLLTSGAPPHLNPWAWLHGAEPVTFKPRQRQVTNWRREAAQNLDLPWTMAVRLVSGGDAGSVTRCVRLNNYWCIKRAGWAGEIAADTEGHVAFASAIQGADVAALLLRRYYLDYGRHSAMAIVSHWAPASCGAAVSVRRSPIRSARADHLATHGIGHTLRARFLASRGRRGRLRGSAVPDRLIGQAQLRAPSIAVGLGEAPVVLPVSLTMSGAALSALGATPHLGEMAGAAPRSCAGDTARIRAYAEKTAAGVASGTAADLHLFTPDGTPTANLGRVMHNMSAVEIGPLGASRALIEQAVARATANARRSAEAAALGAGPLRH